VACRPPARELCVWVTDPAGVVATAVRVLVWENAEVF